MGSVNNRDEFSENTKRYLALRAGHQCSFSGCKQTTSGPSDESPEAVACIGEAAHIHAAAPGGRRYLASMTPAERKDISNAIWLCSNHSKLIDRDEITYTPDVLRKMKKEHEAYCHDNVSNPRSATAVTTDLVAIGPNIVFTGELHSVESDVWSFHLKNFVDGDIHALITFIDGYDRTASVDRYVVVNALGDGRELRAKLSFTREAAGGYIVRCPVLASATRMLAKDIPASWAPSDSPDLVTSNGNWVSVSGVAALPQQIKTCLSHQRGESPFYQDFGTRFAEKYKSLSGSPWIDRYLKLEVIRQAAIPYTDPFNKQRVTPFLCVERVLDVKILADEPTNKWLPIRVELEVKGLGSWQHDLSIFIPEESKKEPYLDWLGSPKITQHVVGTPLDQRALSAISKKIY